MSYRSQLESLFDSNAEPVDLDNLEENDHTYALELKEQKKKANKYKESSKVNDKSYLSKNKSELRANLDSVILENEPKYRGKRINTSELFKNKVAGSTEPRTDLDSDDDEYEDENDVEEGENSDIEEDDESPDDDDLETDDDGTESSNNDEVTEEDDEDEESSEDGDAQMFPDSSSSVLNKINGSTLEHSNQGECVFKQVSSIEIFVEARIQLQKPMQSAAKLPDDVILSQFSDVSPEISNSLTNVKNELKKLLLDLFQLQDLYVNSATQPSSLANINKRKRFISTFEHSSQKENKGVDEDEMIPRGNNSKPQEYDINSEFTSDAAWSIISSFWNDTSKVRDVGLDDMVNRYIYSGGVSEKKAKKLKVLKHDFSSQTKTYVDSNFPTLESSLHPSAEIVSRVFGVSDKAVLGISSDGRLEQVYDDAELYSKLLKDYVSANSVSKEDTLPVYHKPYVRKTREGIDRRATKGRRMKYVKYPKLVNFMAPVPFAVPPDLMFDIDVIVNSLFKS
jgi:protein AATF/BFR2